MPAMSQSEFAERVGLSYKTISRVLNGHPCVNKATRQRVLAAADELGFRGHSVARSLRLRRSFAIGLVGVNTRNTFWMDVVEAMDQRAREVGYHVVVCHRTRGENSSEEIRFLMDRQVDALVLSPHPTREDPRLLREVEAAGVPLLMLGNRVSACATHYLGTDSRSGTRQATGHLLGLGHRRLAFVTGPEGDCTAAVRLQGCREAVAAAGAELVVVPGGWRREGGLAAGRELLGAHSLPTAVVCVNDATAVGVYQALRAGGVRVPEDVSLVGYSNDAAGELLPVPLTTVAMPVERLGRRAVDLLLELIAGEHEAPVFEEFADELVIRASCVPPARAASSGTPNT